MKYFLISLFTLASLNSFAGPCDKLGDLTGVYYQTVKVLNNSMDNGIMLFQKTRDNTYNYGMEGDLDIDMGALGRRIAIIELEVIDGKCAYIDPLYPEPNIVRYIQKGKKGSYIIKNQNAMSKLAKTILTRME